MVGRPHQGAVRRNTGASPQALRACSACPGDYQDPDRTAWVPEPGEDEELPDETDDPETQENTESQADGDDEFPAQRE
ncbi:MAG: hypothetical protein WBE13_11930 [Candidatus Acidiferrum sp.]